MTTTPVPTCTDDLLEEIEHYWPEELVGMGELVVYLSDYQKLKDRLRTAEKDAERYRFLKDQGHFRAMSMDMGGNHTWVGMGRSIGNGPTTDAAIDAAMESSK